MDINYSLEIDSKIYFTAKNWKKLNEWYSTIDVNKLYAIGGSCSIYDSVYGECHQFVVVPKGEKEAEETIISLEAFLGSYPQRETVGYPIQSVSVRRDAYYRYLLLIYIDKNNTLNHKLEKIVHLAKQNELEVKISEPGYTLIGGYKAITSYLKKLASYYSLIGTETLNKALRELAAEEQKGIDISSKGNNYYLSASFSLHDFLDYFMKKYTLRQEKVEEFWVEGDFQYEAILSFGEYTALLDLLAKDGQNFNLLVGA